MTNFITAAIWRFRLRQALKIADMRRQPKVIKALHAALREQSPQYLDDWRKTMREVGDAVDDLSDLMELLREGKHYAEADRLRTIMSRLANAVPSHQTRHKRGKIYLIRDIARTYK